MKWPVWCVAVAAPAFGARATGAQVIDPAVEVTAERDSATVGDAVPLSVRARLDDRDLLLDSVPRFAGEVPRGMRVLAAERLTRQPDRTFAGRVVIAFYRPGHRVVPPLVLTYRRNVNVLSADVRSDSTVVNIRPVLPAGSGPSLQDIKGLVSAPPDRLAQSGVVAGLLVALFGIGVMVRRRRRCRDTQPASTPSNQPVPPAGALETALERLRAVEQQQWPARGEVARHYEAVVTVLRDYLAESVHIPARASTTAELLAALPSVLTSNNGGWDGRGGRHEQARRLLGEADLVKFARRRPAPGEAGEFLRGARELLTTWASDAIR